MTQFLLYSVSRSLRRNNIMKEFVSRMVALVCVLLCPTAVLGADGPKATASSPGPWPTNGWLIRTPASVGLDKSVLEGLDADLAGGKYMLVDSFQVFRCGAEVFKRRYAHDYAHIYAKEARTKGPLNARLTGPYNYFDPHWHPYYHGTDMHTMQSVTKTVTSVIFGVAMTRGDFKASLSTPVLKFFDVS